MRPFKMNSFEISGNLGKDPQYTKKKDAVYFTLAHNYSVNKNWINPESAPQWEKLTDWHTFFFRNDKIFDDMLNNLKKGDNVLVKGKIKTKITQDSMGINKTEYLLMPRTVEIINKAAGNNPDNTLHDKMNNNESSQFKPVKVELDTSMDEIPF